MIWAVAGIASVSQERQDLMHQEKQILENPGFNLLHSIVRKDWVVKDQRSMITFRCLLLWVSLAATV